MIKPDGWDNIKAKQNKKSLEEKRIAMAAAIVKDHVTVYDAVKKYTNQHIHSGRISCPFCCGDRKDTLAIFPKDKMNRFHCHRCGADGHVISFVMRFFNLPEKSAIIKLNSDFMLDIDIDNPSDEIIRAANAARALREEREAQRREALAEFHRWGDLWILYDDWRRKYPPTDPRYVEAVKRIDWASYKRDTAEARLKQFEQ